MTISFHQSTSDTRSGFRHHGSGAWLALVCTIAAAAIALTVLTVGSDTTDHDTGDVAIFGP